MLVNIPYKEPSKLSQQMMRVLAAVPHGAHPCFSLFQGRRRPCKSYINDTVHSSSPKVDEHHVKKAKCMHVLQIQYIGYVYYMYIYISYICIYIYDIYIYISYIYHIYHTFIIYLLNTWSGQWVASEAVPPVHVVEVDAFRIPFWVAPGTDKNVMGIRKIRTQRLQEAPNKKCSD